MVRFFSAAAENDIVCFLVVSKLNQLVKIKFALRLIESKTNNAYFSFVYSHERVTRTKSATVNHP